MLFAGEKKGDVKMTDIMAASQTESVLSLLDQGKADDATRDQVSAALLRCMTKQFAKLDDIEKKLWTLSDLNDLIDSRHKTLCSNCPARRYVDQQLLPKTGHLDRPKGWLEALCSSESVRLFVIVVILVWAVVYLKTGVVGAEAVKDAASSTLTGGLVK